MAPLGLPVVPLVKVEQRHVFRVCGADGKGRTGLLHERAQILRARDGGRLVVFSDQEDLFKGRDTPRESRPLSLIK